jgi:hypothetical protein
MTHGVPGQKSTLEVMEDMEKIPGRFVSTDSG